MRESGQLVLAVTCLRFEARLAAGPGVEVVCGTHGPRLRSQLEAAIALAAPCGVLSFGVAGGLDPSLRPGDWVVAASVLSDRGRCRVDSGWTAALLAALPEAVQADIVGVDAPVADPAEKLRLRQSFRAAAVDTESHVAATVAARQGIPFAAARVVLDPAPRRLPPAALVPLRPDGTADGLAVLRSVWQTPSQVGRLLMITAEATLARAALARGRKRLGDGLGVPSMAQPEQSAPAEPELIVRSAAAG